MNQLKRRVLSFSCGVTMLLAFSQIGRAESATIFQKTFVSFVSECAAVFEDLETFRQTRGELPGYREEVSKDAKAIAIALQFDDQSNNAEDYLSVFVDHLSDRSVLSCERYFELYGAFDSIKDSEVLRETLKNIGVSEFAGGRTFLHDSSSHQFSANGAFKEIDIPIRVRLFDWGVQFYSEVVVSNK